MKSFLAFFTKPIVLSGIGLLALSLLLWFGASYIKFGADNATLSDSARALCIAVLITGWLTWHCSRWLLQRHKGDQLIQQLSKPEPVAVEDDRAEEEVQLLSERFADALSTLKSSRFSNLGGARTLYQLPWYIIIGPPGAGKTTALVNSGLEFPLVQSHGKAALAGVGGTRHCDWWFTNEAVLIDTAGRYTSQDSHCVIDQSAWQTFLLMLKKYRRRRPINGLIVAISLQDLLVQSAEQRLHQAKTLRARINELQQQLGIRFPIYLTFTKCDLVAGFSEFFANLSQAEREQVWGLSFDADSDLSSGAPLERFSGEFGQLIERLNQRLLWRLHQERNYEKRAQLQSFPARMQSLTTLLEDFVKHTFSPNRYDTVPLLRGVYFTSATQQGSPIDRMMAQVSASFGLAPDAQRQQQADGKSFFISRLLKDVIFPEQEMVGVNRRIERATLWLRRGGFAALAGLLITSLLLWSGSVAQNKRFMQAVAAELDSFEQVRPVREARDRSAGVLLAQLQPLREASTIYDREEQPLLNNLGLYDDSVDAAAEALYRDKLRTLFLPHLLGGLERHLRRLDAQDDELLSVFKVYLMLHYPEKRQFSLIRDYAERQWQQQMPAQAADQSALLAHLDHLLALPPAVKVYPNPELVSRARQQLRRIPVAQRLYSQLKAMGRNSEPVDLYRQLGGDMQQAFGLGENADIFSMPFMFTLEGYRAADFDGDSPLLGQLAEDRWIYGSDHSGEDFSSADRAQISSAVQQLYLSEYASHWQAFINRFRIARFSSSDQALALLNQLADPVYSPLLGLSELTASNTALTPSLALPTNSTGLRVPVSSQLHRAADLATAAAGEALERKRPPTLVDLQFQELQRVVQADQGRPARLHQYLASITQLHTYLIEIDSAADPNQAAFESALARFAGGGDAIKQLRQKAVSAPPPVRDWLEDLADNTWALVMAKSKRHVDSAWRQQVYASYERSLSGRYPMQLHRQRETPVLEFNDFFKPGGIEQSFVSTYIKPFVDTRTWQPRRLEGQSLHLAPSTLQQLRRADNIRRAFFNSSDKAAIQFRIEPTKLDSGVRLFALELGEKRVPYSHGPRTSRSLNWTGGEDNRVRILFEDLNETVHRKHFQGDWAWFRLLEQSRLSGTNSRNIHRVTFEAAGRSAEFKLIAASGINPFDQSLLRNYRCPQTL